MLEKNFKSNIEDIRKCRYEIFDRKNDNLLEKVSLGKDFYTASSVRDLIFNEQEHCFSIPEISKTLYKLKLEFLGFSILSFKINTPKLIKRIKKIFSLIIGINTKKFTLIHLIRCIAFG